MEALSRDEYSYRAERDHLADDTPCRCYSCDASWRYDQLRPIGDCSLTPGDHSPAGRCADPGCDCLAYVKTPDRGDLSDVVNALRAAESFLAGFEGDELQDDMSALGKVRAALRGLRGEA